MYVFQTYLRIDYIHPLPFTELPEYLSYLQSLFSVEIFSPIFRGKYYVVLAIPLRM